MAIFNKAKTLSAVALCAAAFALPATAQARDHRCHDKNDEAQIIGGLLGAVAGGLLGSEVAGRGDRNEGAVIGAIVGGVGGAAIGDGTVKCGSSYNRVQTRTYSPARTTTYHQPARVQTVAHHGGGYNSGYGQNSGYGHNTGYNNNGARRLNRIDRRLDNLRRERKDLKNRRGHGHRPWISRRIDEIGYEIDGLKRERKQIKRARNSRNDYRDNRRGYSNTGYTTSRRGHYHSGSTTLCYSGH